MTISSRTPEGRPNRCPFCGADVLIEPSEPTGDAPCSACGSLVWFSKGSSGVWVYDPDHVAPLRERVVALVCENLDVGPRSVTDSTSFIKDLGAASLDIVELVVEAEEEFEVTIPNKQAEKIGTVGELIGYLLQQRL